MGHSLEQPADADLEHLFRDVLFEYHRAVVPFCRAVRPVRSLSTLE